MCGRLIVQRYEDSKGQPSTTAKDTPDFTERLDQVRREEKGVTTPHSVDRTIGQPGGGQVTPFETGPRGGQHLLGAFPGNSEARFREVDTDQVAIRALGQPQAWPA